jgi:hypothetical protein
VETIRLNDRVRLLGEVDASDESLAAGKKRGVSFSRFSMGSGCFISRAPVGWLQRLVVLAV